MLKNKQKRKKGFTLIELVIVLAVLAIIALIAIPNFTKVRNDSKVKADLRSAEQIEKITLMAVADKVLSTGAYTLTFNNDKTFNEVTELTGSTEHDYEVMLKDVKKPQVASNTTYYVTVGSKGDVQVRYSSSSSILAGPATLSS